MKRKSLYAYFGLLGLYDIDSPGHSFYQLGLIDSLRESFNEEKFDFYSYYPTQIKHGSKNEFSLPEGRLASEFQHLFNELISPNNYNIALQPVLDNIKNREYGTLYLKARFRNLSTLSKKWDDAFQFEQIINAAISAKYEKSKIVILDTDLSLPENFIEQYKDLVTILIPSIDFPGISNSFLRKCIDINLSEYGDKEKGIVFYGNLDTSNYKHGNDKSQILQETLKTLMTDTQCPEVTKAFPLYIVGKKDSDACKLVGVDSTKLVNSVGNIWRTDRYTIWQAMENNLIMLNVTKEKYNDRKFIPARIYEAMIFGMIPVSYKFEFLSKTFSYSDMFELYEILRYLNGVGVEDLKKAYTHFCDSYSMYEFNLRIQNNGKTRT